jgi:hypothetical protein
MKKSRIPLLNRDKITLYENHMPNRKGEYPKAHYESDILECIKNLKKRLSKELEYCPNQIFSIMDEELGVTKDE